MLEYFRLKPDTYIASRESADGLVDQSSTCKTRVNRKLARATYEAYDTCLMKPSYFVLGTYKILCTRTLMSVRISI